jgi:type IV pilus assembly protein PilA
MKCRWIRRNRARSRAEGFTLIEISIVVAILLVLLVIAVPTVQGAIETYRMQGAVSNITGAIRSTRYQAISDAVPYTLAFSKAAGTYQVQWDPTNTGTFVAKTDANGTPLAPIPVAPAFIGADTTFQFRPSGQVSAAVGAMTMSAQYHGQTKAITVTPYGNITVTP